MQTPTVHPPAAAARMRKTNISSHSKGNATLKISEYSIFSHIFLTIGRSMAFRRLVSSAKGASPLAPLQDSIASANSLVSAMSVLERNSFDKLAHSEERGKQRRQRDIFC